MSERRWRLLTFRFERKWQDAWIGVYWKYQPELLGDDWLQIWVCFVPFFPLFIQLVRGERPWWADGTVEAALREERVMSDYPIENNHQHAPNNDVICLECNFRYGAEHRMADDSYKCPLCDLAAAEQEIERLREAVSPYHVGGRYGPTESQVAILQEWARQNDERLGYSGSSLSQYLLGIAKALQGGDDE